jgi:hypothetical protein
MPRSRSKAPVATLPVGANGNTASGVPAAAACGEVGNSPASPGLAPAPPSVLQTPAARSNRRRIVVRSPVENLGAVAAWELEVLLPVIHAVIERALQPNTEVVHVHPEKAREED